MIDKKQNNNEQRYLWKPLKIHSADDVIKAGGPEKYARKIGHVPLKVWPTIEFTDEEWAEIEEMLARD